MKKRIAAMILCVSVLAGVLCLTGCAETIDDGSINEMLRVVMENSVGSKNEMFDRQEDGKLYAIAIDVSEYSAYDLTEFARWAKTEYSATNIAVIVMTTPNDVASRSAYISKAMEEFGLEGYWYSSDNVVALCVKLGYAPQLGHSRRISVQVIGEYLTSYHPFGWRVNVRRTRTGWECIESDQRTY